MKVLRIFLFLSVFSVFSALIIYLSLFYFLHERNVVAVPNFVGTNIDSAQKLADKRGLKIFVAKDLYNASVPKNFIIQQRQPEGIRIKKGENVEIILSKGAELIAVPDVVGKNYRYASVFLHKAGLNIGNISEIYDTYNAAGQIINQATASGALAPRESNIDILVSLGTAPKKYIIPDIKGMSTEEIDTIIQKYGLDNVQINYTASDILPDSTVIKQQPAAYSFIAKDDFIQIWVARTPKNNLLRDYKMRLLNYTVGPGLLFKNIHITLTDEIRKRVLYSSETEPFADIEKVVFFKAPAKIDIFENKIIRKVISWN